MNKIILIGGTEGTGKSTLAKQLGEHFQVPLISTDQIRRILQVSESDEAKRAALVWNGTAALVREPYPWEGAVIEGTAILPDFIARDFGGVTNIKPIFLIYKDEEKIVQVIRERSTSPFINTKTSEQQTARVEKLKRLNREIRERAEFYGYPCIPAHDSTALDHILSIFG